MTDRLYTTKLFDVAKGNATPDFDNVKIVDDLVFGTTDDSRVVSGYGYDWVDTIEYMHNGLARAGSYLQDVVGAVFRATLDTGSVPTILDFESRLSIAAAESRVVDVDHLTMFKWKLVHTLAESIPGMPTMPANADLSILLDTYGLMQAQFPDYDVKRGLMDRIKDAVSTNKRPTPVAEDAFHAFHKSIVNHLTAADHGLVEIGNDRREIFGAMLDNVIEEASKSEIAETSTFRNLNDLRDVLSAGLVAAPANRGMAL